MKKSAQNCLLWSLALLVLPVTFGTPAFSQGYDDDGVEIEVAEPDGDEEVFKPPPRSRKRFGRSSGRDDERLGGGSSNGRTRVERGRRGDSKASSRGGQPPTGPGNERFGKTKGKVKFFLVDDPAKKLREQARSERLGSYSGPAKRKQIRLGPEGANESAKLHSSNGLLPNEPVSKSSMTDVMKKSMPKKKKTKTKTRFSRFGKQRSGRSAQ
jgi:hypothetical protein